MRNIKSISSRIVIGFLLLLLGNCQSGTSDAHRALEVVLQWNRYLLELERYTEGYRPPVASRVYAYVGLTAYEAALPALKNYTSFAKTYPHCTLPPVPGAADFHLPSALNAAYARIMVRFFEMARLDKFRGISKLEDSFQKQFEDLGTEAMRNASITYGQAVADSIYKWSSTDTHAHLANLHAYDPHFTSPPEPGKWQSANMEPTPALLPHWGKTRPFLLVLEDYQQRAPTEFSKQPGSPFYSQAFEVYSISHPLSDENQWVADFWSDDHPGLTFTAPGRWISVTNQVIAAECADVAQALEVYLKVGIALCDASILCWKLKYQYLVERPHTYIDSYIEKGWRPYSESPPFPSYPSGHSTFGSAAAEVLQAFFGNYAMTDNSHEGRVEFNGKPRHFKSFQEMALENAYSRMSIGVHYRMDCEEGLRLGKFVGDLVARLNLHDPQMIGQR